MWQQDISTWGMYVNLAGELQALLYKISNMNKAHLYGDWTNLLVTFKTMLAR